MSIMDTQRAEWLAAYCDCIGEVAEGAEYCPHCGREYGLPIQVTADDYGTTFTEFAPTSEQDLTLTGEQALAYVIRHGHTISVSIRALRFARVVAVRSMHGLRDDSPVMRTVNKALDCIDRGIRGGEQAEREQRELRPEQATAAKQGDARPDGNRAEERKPKPKSPIGPMPADAIKF